MAKVSVPVEVLFAAQHTGSVEVAEAVESMLVEAGLGKEIDWEDAENSADVLAALDKCHLVQHRRLSQGRCQAAVDFCGGTAGNLEFAQKEGLCLRELLDVLRRCADKLGEMDCGLEWQEARIALGMLSGLTRAEAEARINSEQGAP